MIILSKYNPLRAVIAVTALVVASGASFLAAAQVPEPIDPLSFTGPDPTEKYKDISIQQRLDAQLPLGLTFTDEAGVTVRLGDLLVGKPAILALVYYECPMLCSLELEGLEALIGAVKYDVGEDFSVITVSIDPDETPELAATKKANHLERLKRDGAERGWHFLTGEKENIDTLADTVGFRYVYDPQTGQYAHGAGIMTITPQGRVSRYFMGVEYFPKHVEFGLMDASNGNIGSFTDAVQWLCFQYDPTTGQYSLAIFRIMQILAGLMIVGFLAMYTVFFIRIRKKNRTNRRVVGPSREHEPARG